MHWDDRGSGRASHDGAVADAQGAAKSEYWVDPTSGIAAVFATNLTSPNPDHYMKMYNEFERTLYDSLEEGASDAAPVTLRSNL